MDKEQSLALYAKGTEAWNAWAEKRLAEREALREAGDWVEGQNSAGQSWRAMARVDFSDHLFKEDVDFEGFLFPGDTRFNGTTFLEEAWFDRAIIVGPAMFYRATFKGEARFVHTTFKSQARFGGATFNRETVFDGAEFQGDARFGGVTFKGYSGFSTAIFSGKARFGAATFSGKARFVRATFFGKARFGAATFSDHADFSGAKFNSVARFSAATFSAYAEFSGAQFNDGARFYRVKFLGDAKFSKAKFCNYVGFGVGKFKGYTSFDATKFKGNVSFNAIHCDSAFSLADATFQDVPNFIQAHFDEAPRLEFPNIEPGGFQWPSLAAVKAKFQLWREHTPRRKRMLRGFTRALSRGQVRRARLWWRRLGQPSAKERAAKERVARIQAHADQAARWRALQRLAIQGNDHQREMDFFKNEVLARRWVVDRLRHPVLWFGLFYQLFSDFGRSIGRPFLWWWLGIAVFAGLYYIPHLIDRTEKLLASFLTATATPSLPLACVVGPGEPWVAALQLSLRKGLLFLGLDSTDKLNQIYACLYGAYFNADQPPPPPGQLPEAYVPVIPDLVAMASLAQLLLSTLWIFLFLLAIRNHFRIK